MSIRHYMGIIFSPAFQSLLRGRASEREASLQVPAEVRQARRDELVSLQQDIGQDFANSLVGKEVRDSL